MCERVAECATVLAPLDYDDPDGLAVTLALLRVRGTKTPRLGSLFVNPGGPSIPGQNMALAMGKAQLEPYEVVGWDPRGTGEHLLRGLLGERKVNLMANSYGSFVGSLYATTYPERVGRIILHGAFDADLRLAWSGPFEEQLAAFADYCVEQQSSLGADRNAVLATIRTLVESTATTPLTGADRPVTQVAVNQAIRAGQALGRGGWTTLMMGLPEFPIAPNQDIDQRAPHDLGPACTTQNYSNQKLDRGVSLGCSRL